MTIKVVQSDGTTPVGGATVVMYHGGNDVIDYGPMTTDSTGTVVFTGVQNGNYRVNASFGSFWNNTTVAQVNNGDQTKTIILNIVPPVVQFSASSYSVTEGGAATITVTRTNDAATAVSVSYATSDGTAGSGDYTPASGTLTFNQGEFSKTFTVSTTNDAVLEGDETVNLALSSPTGGATLGTPSSAILTITDNDPAPVVQFSSATYSAGEGSGSATITVTRTNDAVAPVTVSYSTSDGTATAGSDYTAASGTLTFNQGVFSQTFNVPITNDMIFEGDETVSLALSSPTGGSLGTPATAVLTIVDNDPAPVIQFFSATYLVGEGGTATITVTRANDAAAPVSVSYATSDGTAGSGDYTAASGTLTFNPGVFSQTFTVSTVDDAIKEGDETVNLALSSPTGSATLGAQNSAVLTIADNDLAPVVQFSSATYSVAEGGIATITVNRVNDALTPVSVTYTMSDGSAAAGNDYTSTSGTLTFNQGVFSQTFTVSTVDDAVREGDETVNLALSSPIGGSLGAQSSAVLTINDNDPSPVVQFSSATYSVTEGGVATITVTRTNDAVAPVTVYYGTSDGTAVAGSDYTAVSGSLMFNQGEFSKTFDVPTTDDAILESSETVNLGMNATGGSLGTPASAVLTINDNDAPPVVQFSIASYSVTEGGVATITVTRTNDAVGPVTVSYATSDGTAGAGDYTSVSGTLTFNQGVFTQTFDVQTIDDSILEGDETINLALSNPAGGSLGTPNSAVLTIFDNDVPAPMPVVQFSSPSYSVNEDGVSATITVTLTNPVGANAIAAPVSVSYATSDGTAEAGDYTTSSGTLTFSQGEFSKDFIVPVTDDVDVEGDETVNLALSNPAGCVLGTPASAVLTIIDNDQTVTPSPTPSPEIRPPHQSIALSPHSELSYLYENGVLSWVVSGPLYNSTKVAYNIFYGLSTLVS